MKNTPSIFIAFILLIIGLSSVTHTAELNNVYKSNYDEFWKLWANSKEKAISCAEYKETAIFFSMAVEMLGNAEVSEANSKIIENLTISNPQCVLESLLLLESENRNKTILNFLITPMFHENEEIEQSIKQYRGTTRYIQLLDIYYKNTR